MIICELQNFDEVSILTKQFTRTVFRVLSILLQNYHFKNNIFRTEYAKDKKSQKKKVGNLGLVIISLTAMKSKTIQEENTIQYKQVKANK